MNRSRINLIATQPRYGLSPLVHGRRDIAYPMHACEFANKLRHTRGWNHQTMIGMLFRKCHSQLFYSFVLKAVQKLPDHGHAVFEARRVVQYGDGIERSTQSGMRLADLG